MTNVLEMDHAIELESGVVAAGAAAVFVCMTVFLAEAVEPVPADPVVHQVLKTVAAALVQGVFVVFACRQVFLAQVAVAFVAGVVVASAWMASAVQLVPKEVGSAAVVPFFYVVSMLLCLGPGLAAIAAHLHHLHWPVAHLVVGASLSSLLFPVVVVVDYVVAFFLLFLLRLAAAAAVDLHLFPPNRKTGAVAGSWAAVDFQAAVPAAEPPVAAALAGSPHLARHTSHVND